MKFRLVSHLLIDIVLIYQIIRHSWWGKKQTKKRETGKVKTDFWERKQ